MVFPSFVERETDAYSMGVLLPLLTTVPESLPWFWAFGLREDSAKRKVSRIVIFRIIRTLKMRSYRQMLDKSCIGGLLGSDFVHSAEDITCFYRMQTEL